LTSFVNIAFFLQLCIERLLNKQSPSLETIKMQVYFDMNYTTKGNQ